LSCERSEERGNENKKEEERLITRPRLHATHLRCCYDSMLMLIFGDVCFFRLLHDYMLAWLALLHYHSVYFLVKSFFLLQIICVSLIPTFTGVFGDAMPVSAHFAVWTGKIRLCCRELLVSSLGELVFCYCVKIRKTCSKVGFGRKVREIRRYISNESSTITHFSRHM
jgi:hypothetical protein